MTEQINKFRNTLRHFEREIAMQNDNCCNTGLTLSQCHLILDIERLNETTVKELSEAQNLDKSTVSRSIDNLYKKGLINRDINPKSRRETKISLNKEGDNTCCSINEVNNTFFAEVLNQIPDEELKQFNKVFEKISQTMTSLRESKQSCC